MGRLRPRQHQIRGNGLESEKKGVGSPKEQQSQFKPKHRIMDEETSCHRLIMDASSSTKFEIHAVARSCHSSFSSFVEKNFVEHIGHKPSVIGLIVLFRSPLYTQSRQKLGRYLGLPWS